MHLPISEAEALLLTHRVEDDYEGAKNDHQRRMERARRAYQLWVNRVDAPRAGEEDRPNISVPVVQWSVFTRWAQILAAMFGDDAKIISEPVGPNDQRHSEKVGNYMSWRFFSSLRAKPKMARFIFRLLLYGNAWFYNPWKIEKYQTLRGGDFENWVEAIDYEGPALEDVWPNELLFPAEDAQSIHDFSYVIRKLWRTPQQLLDGERAGIYLGIERHWQRIVDYARTSQMRDHDGSDELLLEKDWAEGADRNGARLSVHGLRVWEWYGRWRLPNSDRDAGLEDAALRFADETEVVVRYLPDLKLFLGAWDLKELYPFRRLRRPFEEAMLVKDGRYFGMGAGELLETLQDEASWHRNIFTEGMEFAVGPLIFARPSSGFTAKKRYSPREVVPTADPAGVKVVEMGGDLQAAVVGEQAARADAERVFGVSDQSLGRAIDRPNAPRTAAGQLALIEQGNVRVSLDMMMLREDFSALLARIWEMDSYFLPEEVFFRVTEDDASGVGFGRASFDKLEPEERGGRYDFELIFATSHWQREAVRERELTLYQLDLGNPLIVQNPRALWAVTNRMHKAMGDRRFADLVPMPPDPGLPKQPKEEWTLILQGEDVQAHPNDHDDQHLMDHIKRLEQHKASGRPDADAVRRMTRHIIEHQQQKRTKMAIAGMTQQLAASLQETMRNPEQGGLVPPLPMPFGDVAAALQSLGGQGQPGAGPGSAGGNT